MSPLPYLAEGLQNKLDISATSFKEHYIPTLWLDDTFLYREICEDLLYVTLTLLLSITILNNKELNNICSVSSSDPNKIKIMHDVLYSIISRHYELYKVEYDCLYKLRQYSAYNYRSLKELKTF